MPLWVTIALALAPYVVPPLIGVVAVLVKNAEQHLPAQKRDLLDQIARVVVPSVEQSANLLLNGPGKKELAMQQAAVILQHLGIKKVDPAVLSSFIEAAVKAQNIASQASAEGNVEAQVKEPLASVPTLPNG